MEVHGPKTLVRPQPMADSLQEHSGTCVDLSLAPGCGTEGGRLLSNSTLETGAGNES